MNHRFTLYEQRMTRTRRINRNIGYAAGVVAVAIAISLMWLTSIPGAP